MVGAKSLGCLECKRRKVKCDQRFPKCANCERVGRSCSGPKSHFIRFVRPGAEEHMKRVSDIRIHSRSWKSPATTASERLSADLVHHLRGVDKVGYQLQWFGLFITFLPPRIGFNRALDAAVRCLLQAHHAMLCNKDVDNEGLQSYNESVALIRKDLNDRQTQTTCETVCAAMLLSTYELYQRDPSHSWMTHAGGVSAIFECWGPDRFTSDFELALFSSHYGSIISASVVSGKPCFLDSPDWLRVRNRCLKSFPGLDRYAMDCLAAFASLPTLLRDIKEAQAVDEVLEYCLPLFHAQEFKAKIAQHALKLHLDYLNPTIIWEKPSLSMGCNRTMLEFCDPRVAFRYNFYWAVTIIANKILLAFGEHDESLIQEYQDAAEDIFRSLEYLHTLQPLGAMWLTFAASMAYGVSGEVNRRELVEGMQGMYHPSPVPLSAKLLERIFNLLIVFSGKRTNILFTIYNT